MADHCDIAGDVVERCLDDALARQRGKGEAAEFDPDFDGVHCISCGGDIHPERLKLEKVRCIECQRRFEAQKHRRHINVSVEA